MRVLLAGVEGVVAGWLIWRVLGGWFSQPALLRPNYRGQPIPTAAGIVLALALVLVEAVNALEGKDPRPSILLAVTGFCLLGIIDDLAGAGDQRGFKGHLRALRQGQVTTGLVKLAGGAAVALVAVAAVSGGGTWQLVADAALVALCANLANLFDRAPGRVTKVALVGFLALVATTRADPDLFGPAIVVGAAVGLLAPDLRERLMLGDAGANPLGAAVGLGVVLATPPVARVVTLVMVVLLNLAGEVVSFSRVIDAVPPLRALDRLGRLPTSRSSG